MANKKYKLPRYNNGGDFFTKAGELGKNAGLGYADIFMSAVGMDNVVKDDHYQGYGAKAARGYSDVAGGIAKAALPIAANILAPGSGAAVGAAQQGIGMLNPQEPIKYDEYGNPIQPEKRTTQKIGNVAGQITSAAAPAIASAAASNSSSSSSSGSGSARNGGIMRYGNGGNVSNITQVDGPSHENGGVNIQTPTGEYEVEKQEVIKRESAQDRILSDKLRFPGSRKTIAQDFKPVEALNKIVNNMKLPKEVRASAESKLKSEFDNFYNAQEALKQSKVANYAKRMGVTLPSMDNEQIEPQGQSEQSEGEYGSGGIHIKESKKGTFTAAATSHGKSVQAFASQVLANKDNYSPAMVKKANFARNASKWHHEMGGIQEYGNGGKSITGYNPQTGAHYITPGVGPLTDKQLIAEGYNRQGDAWIQGTGDNMRYYKPYRPGDSGYDANAASAAPYTLKYNPDVEARTQIRSTNNTPNPIDLAPRKPIEFGNIGAYNPNTEVMTESTGFNQPIESQTINVGKQAYGGRFKYGTGGNFGAQEDNEEYSTGAPLMTQNPTEQRNQSPFSNDLVGQRDTQNYNETILRGINEFNKNPNTPTGKKDYSSLMNIGSQILQGVGQNVGNLYDLKRGKETEVEKYDRLTANLLNADATKASNKRLYKNTLDALKGAVTGNPSAYIQSRMGMDINRMTQDQLAQQAVDNANAGILNTTAAANQGISTQEKIANAQNRAAGRNLKGSAYSNIGQNIMGQSKDYKQGEMDKEQMAMFMKYYNTPEFQRMMKDSKLTKK